MSVLGIVIEGQSKSVLGDVVGDANTGSVLGDVIRGISAMTPSALGDAIKEANTMY